jgi:prolipoprotein diacylglyceryltransferase
VIGGALTGSIVAALLDGDVGRWLHIAALPTLVVIGVGKLAMVLGGTGQGQPWLGDWATAYLGEGPWDSLAPALPSHPSQAYEGVATLVILVVLAALLVVPAIRRPDGRLFLIAVAAWATARAIVSTTWRDPVTVGPFRTEQTICLLIVAGCLVGLAVLIRRDRSSPPELATG